MPSGQEAANEKKEIKECYQHTSYLKSQVHGSLGTCLFVVQVNNMMLFVLPCLVRNGEVCL